MSLRQTVDFSKDFVIWRREGYDLVECSRLPFNTTNGFIMAATLMCLLPTQEAQATSITEEYQLSYNGYVTEDDWSKTGNVATKEEIVKQVWVIFRHLEIYVNFDENSPLFQFILAEFTDDFTPMLGVQLHKWKNWNITAFLMR